MYYPRIGKTQKQFFFCVNLMPKIPYAFRTWWKCHRTKLPLWCMNGKAEVQRKEVSETTLLFVGRDRSTAHSSESPLLWLILAPPSIKWHGSPTPPIHTHTHTHIHTDVKLLLSTHSSDFLFCNMHHICNHLFNGFFSHQIATPVRAGAHSLLFTALSLVQKGPQSEEQGWRKWYHSESPLCLALNRVTIPDDLTGSSSTWVPGGAAAGDRVRKQGFRFNFIFS